jgi:hypothetical protein
MEGFKVNGWWFRLRGRGGIRGHIKLRFRFSANKQGYSILYWRIPVVYH